MPALAAATRYHVEATLNQWLFDTLSAITRPDWLPTLPAFVYNWDEITASLPCFALAHIPAGLADTFQGRQAGGSDSGRRALGLLEVSCYVTRTDNPNWPAQLRTMRDMVETAATSTRTVTISNYATPSTPVTTAYKIDLQDVTETPTEADPNPAIQRARVLIQYAFTYRAN